MLFVFNVLNLFRIGNDRRSSQRKRQGVQIRFGGKGLGLTKVKF